jgi:hypothetical protein
MDDGIVLSTTKTSSIKILFHPYVLSPVKTTPNQPVKTFTHKEYESNSSPH